MTEPISGRTNPQPREIFNNLAGLQTFNLVALVLSSLVLSVGKLAAYAADESDHFVYSLAAIAISQSAVTVVLIIFGKVFARSSWVNFKTWLILLAVAFANIFGTFLFEEIIRSWNFEPIPQSVAQRAVSLLFTMFVYLGLGWVVLALDKNFKQVSLGKELLEVLSNQQLELTLAIRDARTFAIREISLEIESTRGSLETYSAANHPDLEIAKVVNELEGTLDAVEIQVNKIANRFSGVSRTPKIKSKTKYSISTIVSAGTLPNFLLPKLISIFAFFGFSSWLSYFISDLQAIFLGAVLSGLSFGIFWIYEKYVVSKILGRPVFVRVLLYEVLIVVYLFFWLLILGFLAGDNSVSYGAALAYSAIPFLFFNAGVVLSGVIASTDKYLEQLTKQATELRLNLSTLDQIRVDEDRIWKSLFAGDISLSPTTASVILRDATMTKDLERVVETIPNVNALWKSVLGKLLSPS